MTIFDGSYQVSPSTYAQVFCGPRRGLCCSCHTQINTGRDSFFKFFLSSIQPYPPVPLKRFQNNAFTYHIILYMYKHVNLTLRTCFYCVLWFVIFLKWFFRHNHPLLYQLRRSVKPPLPSLDCRTPVIY